jgi:hypothetical protein
MADLFPVSLDDQIACVDRELGMRRRVYARRVTAKQMGANVAEREIAAMEAVLATLQRLKESG